VYFFEKQIKFKPENVWIGALGSYERTKKIFNVPENSLSAWTGVNTSICHANRPGGVPDCHLHVFLVG
jgi:hypothetical protein